MQKTTTIYEVSDDGTKRFFRHLLSAYIWLEGMGKVDASYSTITRRLKAGGSIQENGYTINKQQLIN